MGHWGTVGKGTCVGLAPVGAVPVLPRRPLAPLGLAAVVLRRVRPLQRHWHPTPVGSGALPVHWRRWLPHLPLARAEQKQAQHGQAGGQQGQAPLLGAHTSPWYHLLLVPKPSQRMPPKNLLPLCHPRHRPHHHRCCRWLQARLAGTDPTKNFRPACGRCPATAAERRQPGRGRLLACPCWALDRCCQIPGRGQTWG